jgi:uncharacterized protein (DUF433 family)
MDDRVIIDPEIQHGKPIIRGSRVPISRIVGGLAGGMTVQEIVRDYEVTAEDVFAALQYAYATTLPINTPASSFCTFHELQHRIISML